MEVDNLRRSNTPFLLKLSPQIMLKILAFNDAVQQHKITNRLWASGDSLIQTLISHASTDYTMRTCADWKCISSPKNNWECVSNSKCNCINFGSLQMHYTTSLSIRVSTDPKIASFSSNAQFSFSSAYMLQLPPNLTQLQIGKLETDDIPQWNLQSNLIPHIPNAKNMLFLDIRCDFQPCDGGPCFSPFVNLQTLRMNLLNIIDEQYLLTHLPQTLTAFSCNSVSVESEQVAACLPRGLTALSIHRWYSQVPKMPHLKSIVFLRLKLTDYQDTLELPPNLEYFRTLVLFNSGISAINITHTKWPESLTDLHIRCGSSYCDRFHKGLVYLREKITFFKSSVTSWSPLPFADCCTTLVTLNLHLVCNYDPDYFGLDSLVALTHLELYVAPSTIITSLDKYGFAKLKLPARLPPNLHFLKARCSYYLVGIDSAHLYVLPEDTREK